MMRLTSLICSAVLWAAFLVPAHGQSYPGQAPSNQFYAGPTSGPAAVPKFRALVPNDLAGTTVANIAALKALTAPTSAITVWVDGYATSGDGGQGFFDFNLASTAADNGGTIITPNSAPASGRWLRSIPVPGEASVKWFGAKGDGVTNDNTAVANTVAWLGNDSTILFPSGNYLCSAACLSYTNSIGIKIRGISASNSSFPANTIVTLTAATGSLLIIDGAEGVEVSNISLRYNNPAYNGSLIDLRKTFGASLTVSVHIHDFMAGGIVGVATGATAVIRTGSTLKTVIEHGFLQYAQRGVYNSNVEGAVYGMTINDIWFQQFSVAGIGGAGIAWNMHDNAVEPLVSGAAGWYVGIGDCFGCTIADNNIGDANALGTWIDLSAGTFQGGAIKDNLISTGLHSVNLGASSGVTVTGNHFDLATATGPVIAASAINSAIVANTCNVNHTVTTCSILSGAAPAASILDNNDGLGLKIANPVTAQKYIASGSSSGSQTWQSAAATSGTITWPAGTVDFSATGGASQVVKQTSVGGVFTVGTEAISDIAGLGTGVATALAANTNATGGFPTYTAAGPWTPVITTSGTVGTPAYTTQVGNYTQVGQLVTAWFNIILSGWTGAPTGNVSINGLPVAASSTAGNTGICTIANYGVTALAASNVGISGTIAAGASSIILLQASNTATSQITAAQFGATGFVIGVCHYHI